MREVQQTIAATREAYSQFANTPGISPDTRQAVAQAVRFLVADLESAQQLTGVAAALAG